TKKIKKTIVLRRGGPVKIRRESNVCVFGCALGCLSYSQGDLEPQVSLEITLGGEVGRQSWSPTG
ncbi:MAG: hypothetical protein ACK58T_11070, partial [Phycisphaerae bacterium]